LERAKAVILVVDSKDKERIAEASEFLFDILSNSRLVQSCVPILVACNKQDLTLAKKAV
jgi:signal recognition particle receptor subunit beta